MPASTLMIQGTTSDAGISTGPALQLTRGPDGALSDDGRIMATYLHGLLNQPAALLAWAGLDDHTTVDAGTLAETAIDRLADAVGAHLDTAALLCFWA